MATREQLESERWRALALAMARLEAAQEAANGKADAQSLLLGKQADALTAISGRLATLEAAQSAHPMRQLWTAFLVGDWRAKLAITLPPVILLYAFAAGQPLPALAADLLATARMCATGKPEPTHGP